MHSQPCATGWSGPAAGPCATAGMVVFQLAKVAVPCVLFVEILCRIDRFKPRAPPLPA